MVHEKTGRREFLRRAGLFSGTVSGSFGIDRLFKYGTQYFLVR